ncbi:MAG: DUF3858 domain-containing protein, partial [Myxococcales bacterium]|nr:DUF3858 domain-containing protein [Myxococcales bacterium]
VELFGVFAPSARVLLEAQEQRIDSLERLLSIGYAGAQVSSADFEGLTDITRPVVIETQFSGNRWYQESSDRGRDVWLLEPLGGEFQFSSQYAATTERVQPLWIGTSSTVEYRAQFDIPANMELTDEQREWSVESEFGSFTMTVEEQPEYLVFEARFVIDAVSISPEQYPRFREFLQEVGRANSRRFTVAEVGGGQ